MAGLFLGNRVGCARDARWEDAKAKDYLARCAEKKAEPKRKKMAYPERHKNSFPSEASKELDVLDENPEFFREVADRHGLTVEHVENCLLEISSSDHFSLENFKIRHDLQ
ncbi:MAG: hypothetical protein PHX60_07205 [Giesbergeria sp.]|uniref:hypothetical protein n=1 Tax=Giesbergeria sp. TaxID=2818473 RepID=UPI0026211958|nr:hypothetical protein [Giesbergeria sp.]MDD2609474.1 hypothetical protein [Giesbergeria sp.]